MPRFPSLGRGVNLPTVYSVTCLPLLLELTTPGLLLFGGCSDHTEIPTSSLLNWCWDGIGSDADAVLHSDTSPAATLPASTSQRKRSGRAVVGSSFLFFFTIHYYWKQFPVDEKVSWLPRRGAALCSGCVCFSVCVHAGFLNPWSFSCFSLVFDIYSLCAFLAH